MDNAVIGFVLFVGIWHFFLIATPIRNVRRAEISASSKVAWCAILILIPFIGVVVMHFLYGTGLFYRSEFEVNEADERARSGTLAPRDDD